MHRVEPCTVLFIAAISAGAVACNGNSDDPYKPVPAWSGRKANIPAPPTLPTTPIKDGDSYTVYGAAHHLRSLVHSKEVTANSITVEGYIVDSNIPTAPECAIHPTGKKDPDTCVDIPIPSFWIADTKDANVPRIRVIGWARNFAMVYDAMRSYRNVRPGSQPDKLAKDDMLNIDVPFPLPAVGAKVKVTGRYGVSGRAGSSDLVSDPVNGTMTYEKLEYIEPPSEPAAFAKKI